MGLRHQLAQVQAQAHTAGAAFPRGVGTVERLGEFGHLIVCHVRTKIAHGEFHALPCDAVQRLNADAGRATGLVAVAQGVVQQIAYQQTNPSASSGRSAASRLDQRESGDFSARIATELIAACASAASLRARKNERRSFVTDRVKRAHQPTDFETPEQLQIYISNWPLTLTPPARPATLRIAK